MLAGIAAAIGVALPLGLLAIDQSTPGGWWPEWIVYLYPTAYMLGAASGIRDYFFYELAAISIAINLVLYAFAGLAIAFVLKMARALM